MFKNLFGRGKKVVVCPRCLQNITIADDTNQACSTCRFELPIEYIRNFDDSPPIFIQVFGWTNHGKTMFLDTLRLILLDMGQLWREYVRQPLTEVDVERDKWVQSKLRHSIRPDATPPRERNQNEVYISHLHGMSRWNNRQLVIMDHPGEYFADFKIPVQEIPFLVNTPTTIMLISLPDVLDDNVNTAGERVDQLLNNYIQALLKAKVDFKKQQRKLVIVLTKADTIRGLPQNIRNYLLDDPIWPGVTGTTRNRGLDGVELAEYLERMQRVSDEIAHWMETDTRNVPGGANMVRLLKLHNISARFAVMSATGREIDPSTAGNVPISPHRVLDTFLWALEFQSKVTISPR